MHYSVDKHTFILKDKYKYAVFEMLVTSISHCMKVMMKYQQLGQKIDPTGDHTRDTG